MDSRDSVLRTLRKGRGWSLRQLAALTGINKGRLSIIERGVEPSTSELDRIMTAFYGLQGRTPGDGQS